MRLLLLVAISSLATGCAGLSAAQRAALEADARPAVEALRAAKFADADRLANDAIARDERNAQAHVVSALAQYVGALRDLVTDGFTFGTNVAASLAFGRNLINRSFLDFAAKKADDRLAGVERSLSLAERDQGFSLELCLACWPVDWNRDDDVNERDHALLEVERDGAGDALPLGDPRRQPTFRFDVADVAWLRALVGFQRGAIAFIQGWDVDAKDLSLLRMNQLHLFVRDSAQLEKSRALLDDALAHARRCRTLVLAETDDDREWLPNPTQRSHAIPLEVDAALMETWAGVLDDARKLLSGEEGLAVAELVQLGDHPWEHAPSGFIDVSQWFRPGAVILRRDALRPIHGQDANGSEVSLKQMLGEAYRPTMPPSKLPSRLLRMQREVKQGGESFDRKLRYLLWLN